MRVLVTGGTGFIGSATVNALLKENFEVAIFDRAVSNIRNPSATVFQGDVRNPGSVRNCVETFAPDVVFHAAGCLIGRTRDEGDADEIIDTNVKGGLNILHAMAAIGVRSIVYTSSAAVYGEIVEGRPANESKVLSPRSIYAASKAAFELVLQAFMHSHGIGPVILRYANVYGCGQTTEGGAVVATFLSKALAGQPLVVYSQKSLADNGCLRDYIYVDDVVSANLTAIKSASPGDILNVGTGETTSTQEVAQLVCDVVKTTSNVVHAPPREGELKVSVLDCNRLRNLGWKPTVSLEQGIEKMVQHEGGSCLYK